MKLPEELRLTDSPAELRRFGFVLAAAFLALSALFFFKHRTFFPYAFGASVFLAVAASVRPRALKHIRFAWMCLGFAMGSVMSRVVLGVLFFGVVTPIGLILRASGKDPLERRFPPEGGSFWKARPEAKPNYEKQY